MKMNSSNMFFLTFMIIGVMMCLCSNNWLFIWCGLELSLIAFLPLISGNLIISSESSIKYFLIQSVSSSIFILALMMMLEFMVMSNLLMMVSMLIKMGVAPFHLWVLSVVEGLNMISMVSMLTWLKIAPMMIISLINLSISLIILLTLVTGSLMGLNQNSLKKLIAYSSIFNMGLLLCTVKNNTIWIYLLFTYSSLIFLLGFNIIKMNMNYINQLIILESNFFFKMNLFLILLSLGGVPPLMGFTIKLLVIEFLMENLFLINLIMIIISSLLVMFFYMRIMYLSLMFFSCTFKWILFSKKKSSIMIMLFNIMALPILLTMKMFY
uniref:NADH dehydrogenase subunit 2 n=1 Tax=Ossuaria sichuanensis TaxID=3060451 RepID=UPI00286BBAA9|nr:NADH dehydrogenase subunit 2 [Ossuaria sichuanensis]WKW96217.1 NADH dehydrogenase subunit 2 [Ossuaria sichuanensis]